MREVVDAEPPPPRPPRLRHRRPVQPIVEAEIRDWLEIELMTDWPLVKPNETLVLPIKVAEDIVLER
ncbi:MAG: hypothetical protein Q9224_000326, partial [Gallowayella concinna]